MDSTSYQSPLRAAVVRLVVAKQTPLTAVAVAAAAGVPEDRARAYLSILVGSKVLRAAALGAELGGRWKEWSGQASRARPRGSANPRSSDMDALRRPLADNVKRLREAKGWTSHRLAVEAGINPAAVHRLEASCTMPPFVAVVMIARALGQPVEVLISKC